MLTLADDSGLEVDALGGRPGVRSARFAHERATDAENNAALLAALAEVEPEQRVGALPLRARLVDPWAPPGVLPLVVDGSLRRLDRPRASRRGGFGYDPLFLLAGDSRTMAELDDDEKNAVSHRARAVQALRPLLASLLEQRTRDATSIAGR